MKKIFKLFAFAIMLFPNTSCINKKMSNTVEVVLQETIPIKISCGNISYATGFKFKLLSGINAGKIIVGIVKCPDTYGDVFTEGAKFKIEISTDMSDLKTYQIFNNYQEVKFPQYSVTKVEITK